MDKIRPWTGTGRDRWTGTGRDRVELAEDVRDLADAKKATLELASGEDEAIPVETVNRLMAGYS